MCHCVNFNELVERWNSKKCRTLSEWLAKHIYKVSYKVYDQRAPTCV